MRFTLSLKIFAAFFMLSILSVTSMVFIIRYFAQKSFEDYVFQQEKDKLGDMANTLSEFYNQSNDWNSLREDPRSWRRILAPEVVGEWRPEGPEENPPQDPNAPPRDGSPPPQDRSPPPPPRDHDRPGFDRPPPRQAREGDPRDMMSRLSLFDYQKRRVAGGGAPLDELSLVPVVSNGQTVGWLGLHRAPKMMHPLDRNFLEKQTGILYLAGFFILLLSTPVAFLLARNLLAPIGKLTTATAMIAERKFETRVLVDTSDELGQLANDFNAMAQTLGAYEQSQKQWLSDISHEMRTPLTLILCEIEAIQDGVRKYDAASLSLLHNEAERLSKIIADLHTLSMAEAGSMSLQKKLFSPAQIASETLEVFKTRFEQNRIELITKLESKKESVIMGDETLIARVFSNLFENVLRYADKPGTLWISQDRIGKNLVISVEDSGPGVPAASLPRLFDRLYRVDQSRSRATGGSGLGLAITKAIVQAHNGKIRALHGSHDGLRVEIELPLR